MRTSLATTFSIVGVLASGAGAFAVNSYVLNSSSEAAYVAPAATIVTPTGDIAASIDTGNVSGAATDLPDPQKAPTTTNRPDSKVTNTTTDNVAVDPVSAPVSTAQTTTYNVGQSGRVTVTVNNGELRVTSVTPNAGWSAKLPEYDDGEIEVEFYSGSLKVEFKARLVNGEVAVFVESEDESADDSYEREDHDDHEDEDDD